jgi:hypothetical protein
MYLENMLLLSLFCTVSNINHLRREAEVTSVIDAIAPHATRAMLVAVQYPVFGFTTAQLVVEEVTNVLIERWFPFIIPPKRWDTRENVIFSLTGSILLLLYPCP